MVNSSRMSSSQWNCRKYSGSGATTLVTVTMWLSASEEEGEMTQGGCVGSLDINQISRYCGLKIVVGHKIYVGKCTRELGGFGGKSSYKISMNHGGVGSASGSGEII